MNIETLVREANPAPLDTVPGPDSFEARRTLLQLTSEDHGARSVRQRLQERRPVAFAIFAVAALVISAVVLPFVTHHSTPSRVHTAVGTRRVQLGSWKLAGYITQPGVQVSSGSIQLSTSQQFTTQLACPTSTTCYSDGTNVANVNQNSQSVITVTHDGGATWHQVLAPGHGIYFYGFTCPNPNTCMVAGSVPNSDTSPSMFTTTDGGTSWTSLPMPGSDASTVALSCATISHCVVLENVRSGENPKGVSYFTTDGGHTWNNSTLPGSYLPSGTGDPDLQCFVDGRCIAMGNQAVDAHGQRGQDSVAAIYSTDEGATWASGTVPPMTSSITTFGVVSCADGEHCVSIESAQSTNGSIPATSGVLVTDDGGQTWTSIPTAELNPAGPATPTSFDSISCSSAMDCWASGQTYESLCQGSCAYVPPQGVLMATNDGGQSWTAVPLPTPPSPILQYGAVSPVSCVIGADCFAVGILATTKAAANGGTPTVNQDVVLTNGVDPVNGQ
jgi:photosystem II stability/assembly factor-like uncharacterized protein